MKLIELLFSPEGRVSRLGYLGGHILIVVLGAIIVLWPELIINDIDMANIDDEMQISNATLVIIALDYLLAIAFGVYSAICLAIKRFRDTGFSTTLTALMCLPIICFFIGLFLLFYPGKK